MLSGYPTQVALTEPDHPDVVATRGGFFPVMSAPAAVPPGGTRTLVIDTDSYCDARPAGGPPGPLYHHARVVLDDGGTLTASTQGTRPLDVGCGAQVTEFGRWQ